MCVLGKKLVVKDHIACSNIGCCKRDNEGKMRAVEFERSIFARNYEYSFLLHHLSFKEPVVIVSSEVLGGILLEKIKRRSWNLSINSIPDPLPTRPIDS